MKFYMHLFFYEALSRQNFKGIDIIVSASFEVDNFKCQNGKK